jgi:predicted permease
MRQFSGRPDVIGRSILLSGVPHTIVGVAGASLGLPEERDLLVPLLTDSATGRRNDFLRVIGRLRPGVGVDRAQQELSTIARRLEVAYPQTNAAWGVEIVGLQEQIVGPIRPALLLFMGAVALVLLIACANVANLMLARVASREREITIRAALGASRRRLVRAILTESGVIALAGGALGVVLAVWGVATIRILESDAIPRLGETRLDVVALAFALGVSLASGLLLGLIPAAKVLARDRRGALREGARGDATGRSSGRTRGALVLGEVSMAFVLLIGAALLLRSFDRLQRVDPGFQGQGVITARISLPRLTYGEDSRQAEFASRLLAESGVLPGVRSVAVASDAPMTDNASYWGLAIAGAAPPPADEVQDAAVFRVSPDYFQTLGIPLASGRSFDANDRAGSTPVVLISRTMAEKFWPGRDPIGARITFDNPDSSAVWRTVVGIVGDVHEQSPGRPPYPQVYLPFAQATGRYLLIAVRTSGDPRGLVPALRRVVNRIDPGLPLSQVSTMEERVATVLARPRINAVLLGGFACTALLLAVIGIYGVIAYGVVQRTRELGIRMALGARGADVLRLVVRQGMNPVLAGIGMGLVGALAGGRLLRSLLFGVGPTDPIAFGAVTIVLFGVGLAATWLPARRATRADPLMALRAE